MSLTEYANEHELSEGEVLLRAFRFWFGREPRPGQITHYEHKMLRNEPITFVSLYLAHVADLPTRIEA